MCRDGLLSRSRSFMRKIATWIRFGIWLAIGVAIYFL